MNIELYPNHIVVKDEDCNKHNKPLSEAYKYLWEVVDVHPSVTVRTLLKALESPNIDFWKYCLMEPYIDDLYDFYINHLKDKKIKPNYSYLEISVAAEKYEDDFIMNGDVSGYKADEETCYGLTLTGLSAVIDCPIKIDTKFEYTDDEGNDVFLGNNPLYLIEVMKYLFYELTFLGSEEDKMSEKDKLIDIVEEYKRQKGKDDESS